MKKTKDTTSILSKTILGLDIVCAIIFFVITIYVGFNLGTYVDIQKYPGELIPFAIIFGIFGIYWFFCIRFFKNSTPKLLTINLIVLHLTYWFFVVFIGYFFASSLLLPFVLLTTALLIAILTARINKAMAISLFCFSIIVGAYTIRSNFEEDYCYQKGENAAKNSSQMITATKEDEELLKGFNVKAGNQIGRAFKVHMECHLHFNLGQALKEKYLLSR